MALALLWARFPGATLAAVADSWGPEPGFTASALDAPSTHLSPSPAPTLYTLSSNSKFKVFI